MEPTARASALDRRLQDLLDKQEIHEVLARYCRGLDRGDYELVRSAFHPDAVHNHDGTVQPVTGLVEGLKNPARKILKSVSHGITNELVDLRGDIAYCESYFLACHLIEHQGADWTWMVGGRYVDRLERRDGSWRIAHRTAVYDWARADRVGARPDGLALVRSTDEGVWGRGAGEDFSYRFPPQPR
jgi:hypothetical protein